MPATDLKKGERVKLVVEKAEGVHEVPGVTKEKFHTDFSTEGDKGFVFGCEVDDFRTVDYDALAMLNVSATQQIKKELDTEVQALKAENAAMRACLDAWRPGLRVARRDEGPWSRPRPFTLVGGHDVIHLGSFGASMSTAACKNEGKVKVYAYRRCPMT